MQKLDLSFDVSKATKAMSFGLILFSIAYIVLYVRFGIRVIASPYQYDYGEGFHWYLSNMLAQGHNIYHSVNQQPYVTVVYTPIYYLVSALGIKIFGSYLAVGRTISLISCLVSSGLIFLIVKSITTRKIPSLVASVLPLTVGFFGYWTTVFRVDTLALCFSLGGILVVVKTLNTKRLYWAVPLFLAALFTKQDYIAAPVAVIIWLFFKDRIRCFKFTGLMISGGLLLLGICTVVFGTSFLEQTFLVGSQPHSWSSGGNLLYYAVLSMPVIIVFSLAYIYFRVKGKKLDLFCIYLPLTIIICLCLIFKQGAWLNYFMEIVAVGSITIGLLLGALLNRRTKKCLWQFMIVSCCLILPISPIMASYAGLDSETEKAYEVIGQQIEETSGPVLCEDATLLMESGKEPVWEPSVFVQGGYYLTTWDQTPFVNEIASQNFGLIVLNYNVSTWWSDPTTLSYPNPHDRLTLEMATAIKNNYHLDYNISYYWVYSPNE